MLSCVAMRTVLRIHSRAEGSAAMLRRNCASMTCYAPPPSVCRCALAHISWPRGACNSAGFAAVAHEWWARASRCPVPNPAQLRRTPNAQLAEHVLSNVAALRHDTVRAVPSAPSTTAAGRALRRPRVEPHYNPVQDALALPLKAPRFLRAPDAVVYPILAVRSAHLPCSATVRWDRLFRDGVCPYASCAHDVDGSVGACTAIERRWRCVRHVLFECSHAPAACPRPADLWDDILGMLPACSPSRSLLRQALLCDVHDPEAVSHLCVPWVTDPAAMLVSDGARVRDCVGRLVAAYLLAVGAAVSNVPVPTAHFQALHLTRTTRFGTPLRWRRCWGV